MLIKTKTAIAAEYGVCRKTLRKWMKAMPYEFPGMLTAPWQKLIYEELGYPKGVKEEDFAEVRVPKQYRRLFEGGE